MGVVYVVSCSVVGLFWGSDAGCCRGLVGIGGGVIVSL